MGTETIETSSVLIEMQEERLSDKQGCWRISFEVPGGLSTIHR